MKYKSSFPLGSKDTAHVKVLKSMSKSKVKVTRSKVLVPKQRSHHEASIHEISKPYSFSSKDIAQVKVFEK